MRTYSLAACCLALALAAGAPLVAQASAATAAEPYTREEFPRWALDLRRAEAVAFGSLPFTVFFCQTAFETYRCSQNDWDSRYAPWPFKAAGAVSMSEDEFLSTFAYACVGAVAVAAVDFLIVTIRRQGERKAKAGRVGPDFRIDRADRAVDQSPEQSPEQPPETP